MGGDLYRDAYVGIRARLGELSSRVQDREAEVTESFWEALPAETSERLLALRGGLELASATELDELARGEELLAAYLAELEGLLEQLGALEAEFTHLPDEVDVALTGRREEPWEEPVDDAPEQLAEAFRSMIRERAPDAVLSSHGQSSHFARFRSLDAPFAMSCSIRSVVNAYMGDVSMSLFTSIRRATPPLVARHESMVLTVGKAFGIKEDVEVGDPSFDGLFLLEGTQEAADLILTAPVRNGLLTLARFDVPTLVVDPGRRLASLGWRFEPAPKALDAAVRVLAAIRHAPPSRRFRR
ncbi:MAG: hypothetical protein JWP97_3774 [Labilithrix sp.]|nr:hypothetical protein [Labilithrix sp.]